MSAEQTQAPESTSTPVTEAAPAANIASPASVGDAASASTEGVVAPAWKPDFSYDFNGKKREVDEFLRPLAKDDETLKKVRDFVKKGDLADVYKKDMLDYKSRIGEYEPDVQAFNKIRGYYQSGNHERALQALGYSDEMLFDIVFEKLQRQKADPMVQKAWQQKTQAELAHEQLLEQNQSYKSQAEQNLARVTEFELESELSKPEVQGIKTAYERVNGVGSFEDMLLERGDIMVRRAGKHIPPSELIQAVVKDFSPFLQGQQAPSQAAADPSIQTQQNQQPTQKPKVIPVVRGSGSPTKGGVRSLDDLRKLAKAAQ